MSQITIQDILAQWHLNYETSEPYPLAEISPNSGLIRGSNSASAR